MRSPLAGWMRPPIALLLAIAGALVVVPAAHAGTASLAPVAPIAPLEGETVVGDPVLEWTAADGTGYEVRWNTDGSIAADGALDPGASGGRAFPGSTSHQLTGLVAPTYFWQARALPDGAWSPVVSFHLDIQLETLDEPVAPVAPTAPEPTPDAGAPPVGSTVSGFVWIASASTFAGLLLAVVGREWLRLRRQEP